MAGLLLTGQKIFLLRGRRRKKDLKKDFSQVEEHLVGLRVLDTTPASRPPILVYCYRRAGAGI